MSNKHVKQKSYERKKPTLKCGGEYGYNLDMISDIQIVSICAPKGQINTLNIKVTKEKASAEMWGRTGIQLRCDIQIVSVCAPKCQINTLNRKVTKEKSRH